MIAVHLHVLFPGKAVGHHDLQHFILGIGNGRVSRACPARHYFQQRQIQIQHIVPFAPGDEGFNVRFALGVVLLRHGELHGDGLAGLGRPRQFFQNFGACAHIGRAVGRLHLPLRAGGVQGTGIAAGIACRILVVVIGVGGIASVQAELAERVICNVTALRNALMPVVGVVVCPPRIPDMGVALGGTPLGVQGHRATVGQSRDGGSVRIAGFAAVLLGVPALEGRAVCPGKAVGGEGLAVRPAVEGLVGHRPVAAVGVECYRIRPGEDKILAPLRLNDGSRKSVWRVLDGVVISILAHAQHHRAAFTIVMFGNLYRQGVSAVGFAVLGEPELGRGGGDVNARKIIRAGIVACGDGGPPQQICSGSVI